MTTPDQHRRRVTTRGALRALDVRRDRPEALLTAAALPIMLILALAGPDRPLSLPWTLVIVALTWLPLTLRSVWPLPVLGVVFVIDTVDIALAGHGHPVASSVPIATMLAVYTVATRFSPTIAWATAGVVGTVQLAVALIQHPTGSDWLYLNWAVVAAAIGRLMKERQDRIAAADLRAETAERTKQAEADRQVTAERLRIAHELHDVLAHHIAVVNAQAGVAQYLLERDPAAAAAALQGITTNSRAALDELRATLGLLRAEGDDRARDTPAPAPTIEQLDQLLDGFTSAGMRLRATKTGDPAELSAPAELALYRIVQEALTNATKHAPGSDVHLDINWDTDHVHLTITNTAAHVPRGNLIDEGTGHGLIGMRERATAAGGSLTFETTPDGGHRVVATLPLANAASRPRDTVTPVHPAAAS